MKKLILVVSLAVISFSAHARRYHYYPRYARHFSRHHHGFAARGTPILGNRGVGSPVWYPFISNLAACAPGCRPYNFNVYRRDRRSCHAQGRAIDVGALNCGGQIHTALNGGIFSRVVACMQGRMTVLFHNGRGLTEGHFNHAHFSIGCSTPGHPNHW